jgi:hypothetical protein
VGAKAEADAANTARITDLVYMVVESVYPSGNFNITSSYSLEEVTIEPETKKGKPPR